MGGDHDEADERHHLHAIGENVIGVLPIHRAGKQQNTQAGKRTHHEAIGFEIERLHDNLHRKGGNDGHDGNPDLIGRRGLLVLRSGDG